MLEFADDYLLTLLQDQWALLAGTQENAYADAADLATWKKTMSSRVAKERAEDARAIFVDKGNRLIFYEAWNPVLFSLSQYTVAVGLEEQKTTGQFFHNDNAGGVADGVTEDNDAFASRIMATIGLYILAPQKPICTFVQSFLRIAVLCYVDQLVDDLGIDLTAGPRVAALVCPPEFAPNGQPQVYGRKVEFDFEVVETVTRLGGGKTIAKKPVIVHEDDDPLNSVVDRETRVETPLGRTVFGGVKIKKG